MTFQCPADIVSSTTPRSSGYVVDFGSCSRPLPECDGFGTESDNVYRKSRDFIDGMSTTVAYGEKLLPPSYAGQSGLDLTAFKHDWVRLSLLELPTGSLVDTSDEVANACRLGTPPVPMQWTEVAGVQMTHLLPPNSVSCFDARWAPISVSSQHGGGVNVAFVDGSVRFVNDSIDLIVWRSLGTREGSETISEF